MTTKTNTTATQTVITIEKEFDGNVTERDGDNGRTYTGVVGWLWIVTIDGNVYDAFERLSEAEHYVRTTYGDAAVPRRKRVAKTTTSTARRAVARAEREFQTVAHRAELATPGSQEASALGHQQTRALNILSSARAALAKLEAEDDGSTPKRPRRMPNRGDEGAATIAHRDVDGGPVGFGRKETAQRIAAAAWQQQPAERMNTCTRCGGKFPTRTSGIADGVTLCTSAAQCDANLAAKQQVIDDTPESDARFLGITVDELQHGGKPWAPPAVVLTLDEKIAIERDRQSRTSDAWQLLPVVACSGIGCEQKFKREHAAQLICRDCMSYEPGTFTFYPIGDERAPWHAQTQPKPPTVDAPKPAAPPSRYAARARELMLVPDAARRFCAILDSAETRCCDCGEQLADRYETTVCTHARLCQNTYVAKPATRFVVRCRVSGGVTGTRESVLKNRDGGVRLFDTRDAAQAEADRLLRECRGGAARFHYWPAEAGSEGGAL